MSEAKSEWVLCNPGLVKYIDAYQLQKRLVDARHRGDFSRDAVLMLEHAPVFTLGLRGGRENLSMDEQDLRFRGIDVVQIERGGDITFHGPGQLVCYLLIDLKGFGLDIAGFVRHIEEVMIRASLDENVTAERDSRNPGVWAYGKKLGSIGIAVRHGITFHGFAFNVNMDLSPFQWIYPCGLKNVEMTSLAAEKKAAVKMKAVQRSVEKHLCRIFNIRLKPVERESLEAVFGAKSENPL